MSAEIIVPLNVGGTIFQTSSLTMLKYVSELKICEVLQRTRRPNSKAENLDEDAEYF